MAEKNLIKIYVNATSAKRVDIIIRHVFLVQRKRLLKNISVVRRIWLILQRSRESLMNPHSRRSIRSVPE